MFLRRKLTSRQELSRVGQCRIRHLAPSKHFSQVNKPLILTESFYVSDDALSFLFLENLIMLLPLGSDLWQMRYADDLHPGAHPKQKIGNPI